MDPTSWVARPSPRRAREPIMYGVILTMLALLFVALAAAAAYERLDGRSAARAALRSALERGEIREEDYARGLRALERAA